MRSKRLFTSKINKNIAYYIILNIVNFMNYLLDPKNPKDEKNLEKGLYVNDDDQDWGSGGDERHSRRLRIKSKTLFKKK